jgi:hypothetical protein
MSASKFATEMVEQDASRDSESDSDIPSDFGICPCEAELERLPEVVRFIKRLQSFLYRQQSKLDKIRKQLKEHVSLVHMLMDKRVFTSFSHLFHFAIFVCDMLLWFQFAVLYLFQFRTCIVRLLLS